MIGSDEFRAVLKQELKAKAGGQRRFELLGGDRQAQRDARAELWEEKLRAFAKHLKIDLGRLADAYSAPEKVRLAVAMKSATSVSNTWLAERLKMGEPASVSQYARRFRLAGGTKEREFKAVLSKVAP